MKKSKLLVVGMLASIAYSPAPSVQAQGLALEEIVVTARKRDENIYEIPVSVSAFNNLALQRAGIRNPDDLSALTAGLDFIGTSATGSRQNPSIRFRGLNQQIITPSTQTGALFWDGSFVAAGGAIIPLGDLERVEIIKGPQTAYFGRNTFSGAVNYIPKTAGDEWAGEINLDYSPSQSDEYNVSVGIGGPITDKVGIRLYGSKNRDGGDFNTKVGDAYAVFKDTSFQGTLTYDSGEKLNLKVSGYYTDAIDNGTGAGVGSLGPDGKGPGQCNKVFNGELLDVVSGTKTPFTRDFSTLGFATFCGIYPNGENLQLPFTTKPGPQNSFLEFQQRTATMTIIHPYMQKYGMVKAGTGELNGQQETYRLQLSGDYEIGNHLLSFKASRSASGTNDVRSFFYGVPIAPGLEFIVGTELYTRETFYEVRLASPQDQRLRYMIGVSDYGQRYRQANGPTGLEANFGNTSPIDFQDNYTTALFAAIDYDITEDFTLSLEARYTDEESNAVVQGDPDRGCADPALLCDDVNEYTDFIPRVILTYRPFEGATTYASYSYSSILGLNTQAAFISTVAPGVIPPSQVAAIGKYTAPQENTQFELGWKQTFDNWAFTLAFFDVDWKNQPFASVIVLPTGGTEAFRNAGSSEYQGFDLEFQGQPTDWLNLVGTLAYTDARMTEFSERGSNQSAVLGSGVFSVVADGQRPRNTPVWTASLSPTILGSVGDRDWFIRSDWTYHSSTFATYTGDIKAPDRFRINARAGIDLNESTSLELWAKNLTNNKTLNLSGGTTSFGPQGSRKAFNQPYQRREIGVSLRANF